MKVSKPVLLVFIGSLALSIYLFSSDSKVKKVKMEEKYPEKPSFSKTEKIDAPFGLSAKEPTEFSKWVRDPFLIPKDLLKQNAERKKEVKPALRLYAIVEGEKGKMAILGEEIVGKGEIIKTGERVVEITKDSVVLQSEDAKRVINLEKD